MAQKWRIVNKIFFEFYHGDAVGIGFLVIRDGLVVGGRGRLGGLKGLWLWLWLWMRLWMRLWVGLCLAGLFDFWSFFVEEDVLNEL